MPNKPPLHRSVHRPPPLPRPPRPPDTRPTAHQRGYGISWQKFRRHRLNIDPLCYDCGGVATDVHHYLHKKKEGGEDAIEETMSLCHRCHSIRTRRGE